MPSYPHAARMTNVEFVAELMQYSRHGALAQMFVIDAITRRANEVAATDKPEAFSTGLFDGQAWAACAQDIKKQIEEFYSRDL